MSRRFNVRQSIYDLYSVDAPYGLEPRGPSEPLRDYAEDLGSGKQPVLGGRENQQDVLEGLDLTLEEDGPVGLSPAPGLGACRGRDRSGLQRASHLPVLGATLSQRKELLKDRIEELVADIRKREELEERLLEKADMEGAGLEFLLGQVREVSPGDYPSIDARRTNLEREILALKKAGWEERLRCWRDLVMLKKELREALEEYHLVKSAEGL